MRYFLKAVYEGRHILWAMVVKDLKARYTGSVLGPLWLVATPLYQLLLYTFLFSIILNVRFDEGSGTSSFVIYLLAGLVPWLFFSESTVRGASAFIDNAHVIKKVNFPLEVCVASVVVSGMVTFFIYLFFYAVILFLSNVLKLSTFLLFIVPFMIQVVLSIGLSFILGSIAVFFRDVTQLLGMALNLLFFLTPIVYPASAIPGSFQWVYAVNPFYFLVEAYRDVLIRGVLPGYERLLYPAVLSVCVFVAGSYVFRKSKAVFKDVL